MQKNKINIAVANAFNNAANDAAYDEKSLLGEHAGIFPKIRDAEYLALKEDIRAHGLLTPIATFNGKIVDGVHRHRACLELGIEPVFQEIPDNISALEFCVAANLHRRHMNEFEKAEVAHNIGMLPKGSNQHTAGAARSQGAMAKVLNTSVDTLQRGNKILNQGTEVLKDAVRSGKLPVSVGAVLADMRPDFQDRIAKSDLSTIMSTVRAINLEKKQVGRAVRVELCNALAANSPTFDGIQPCTVIYADPPWCYLGKDGTPYPTMKIDAICAMEVDKVSTPDAVLLMWVPSAMLPNALKVIGAWGFEYKTSAVWDKVTAGQGAYFRQQHEFLLVATKGKPPCVDPKTTPASVISIKRREHSRKPDCIYEMIEKMYPGLSKLELFSRSSRKGWTMWGNQAGLKKAA